MRWLAWLVVVLWGVGLPAFGAPTVYSFGIVPQQTASTLARLWTPVLHWLQTHSGVALQFATAPDIPSFEARCAEGRYDFAYLNPYDYTVAHVSPGYRAFAHERDRRLQGVLVVPKDSSARSLMDLKGATIAFPAPLAFAASMITQAHLRAAGVHYTAKYVGSHDSVYLTVARGFYPAGGGVVHTFNNTDPQARQVLRILWRSPGYTPHAIAAHPRVDAAVVGRLSAALLAMGDDPEGHRLLAALRFKGFVAASDSDWDDVRALNLRQGGL